MPIAMTAAGNTYYLTYDQVGSLRAVSDSSGNVMKRIDYDSFGNRHQDTNPSLGIPFSFAGGLWDPDTDFVRFGYRDYDPDIGRWTAKDPILFAGGDTDLYGYCLNSPVNLIDPSGELFLGWHFVITISVGVAYGNGLIDSLRLGWETVTADFGTQGLEPEQTNLHAMAGRGQSPEEAIEATKRLIDDPCSSADLASRIHAAQDLATPGHAGVPWSGFHFDLQTAKHILGDLFPSRSTLKNAALNTAYVFHNARNR
jgi:RHS repeat-associated protein